MKKKVLLSVILILLVLTASFTYATEDTEVMPISENSEQQNIEMISNSYSMIEENPTLQNAIIDGNLFVFGTNISLNNVMVYGDIFIAGQNISLSNMTVYGTAFLAGETVNINNASFAGNIFNASQTMNFTGYAQDIFAAAENITINEESVVARELFGVAEKIDIKGGSIGKNVNVSTDQLTIGVANISGILNYSSEKEANISSESTIGSVNFDKVEKNEDKETTPTMDLKVYNVIAITLKSIFVCGFIILFAKGFMEKQKVQNIATYVGMNTLKGLGWTILIPIIGILLLFTGVTVGLSFAIFALYSIILWASVPVLAIAITANITANREYNDWKFYGYTIIISLLIALLKQIPTVGEIITLIIGLAAMGIVISSLKNKKDKKEKVEAEVIE